MPESSDIVLRSLLLWIVQYFVLVPLWLKATLFAGLRILASDLDAENVPRVIVDCSRL